jgi:nucleotidyltransferase/DNA polymerase involved in DNA repair
MDRQIVYLTIPSFKIAVARQHDPTLSTRPLAIAPLTTTRALLRDVSPEAAQDGLSVGMPLEHARWPCPSLLVLPPNPARVQRPNQSLLSVITHYAPV